MLRRLALVLADPVDNLEPIELGHVEIEEYHVVRGAAPGGRSSAVRPSPAISTLCPRWPSSAPRETFDVAFVDLHMPEVDGIEVVQTLRRREAGTDRHLPVIALTARTRKQDRDRCLAAGMDDFLTKPIRPVDMWTAINRVLREA